MYNAWQYYNFWCQSCKFPICYNCKCRSTEYTWVCKRMTLQDYRCVPDWLSVLQFWLQRCQSSSCIRQTLSGNVWSGSRNPSPQHLRKDLFHSIQKGLQTVTPCPKSRTLIALVPFTAFICHSLAEQIGIALQAAFLSQPKRCKTACWRTLKGWRTLWGYVSDQKQS